MIAKCILGTLIGALVFLLARAWLEGPPVTFWILLCVTTFELGCVAFLFRGFAIFEKSQRDLAQEAAERESGNIIAARIRASNRSRQAQA